MKQNKNDRKGNRRVFPPKEAKKRRSKRRRSQTNRSSFEEALQLGQKIFKKLTDVEDLIEMIAREIKRQLDRQK